MFVAALDQKSQRRKIVGRVAWTFPNDTKENYMGHVLKSPHIPSIRLPEPPPSTFGLGSARRICLSPS